MIRFSKMDYDVKYYEQKLGKDRLKSLEKVLRLLGNFPKKEDIVAEYKEQTKEPYSYLYEVKDLDNTSYRFYNFSVGENRCYSENFYLFMQKEDSNFEYIYNFFCYDDKKFDKQLALIEIKYPLSPNRNIQFKTNGSGDWCWIILEEGDKKYNMYLDYSRSNRLLEQLENIILKAKQIDILNLKNVLNLVEDRKKVSSCAIYEQEEKKAEVKFLNGEIFSYQIKEPEKQIDVRIDKTITRTVNRKEIEVYNEVVTDNYERIQREVKRLMKQL